MGFIDDVMDAVSDTVSTGVKKALDLAEPLVSAFKDKDARVVPGGGGYVYAQFPDGSIIIKEGPNGLRDLKVKSGSKAWKAITDEIGPWVSMAADDEEVIIIDDDDDGVPDEGFDGGDKETGNRFVEGDDPYEQLEIALEELDTALGRMQDKGSSGKHDELVDRANALYDQYPEMVRHLGVAGDTPDDVFYKFMSDLESVRKQLLNADFEDERAYWQSKAQEREEIFSAMVDVPSGPWRKRYEKILKNADAYLYAMANAEWEVFALEFDVHYMRVASGMFDLVIKVVDASGDPMPTVGLMIKGEHEGTRADATDASGVVTFADVQVPQSLRIQARAAGTEGETKEVSASLMPPENGKSVTITIPLGTPADGDPEEDEELPEFHVDGAEDDEPTAWPLDPENDDRSLLGEILMGPLEIISDVGHGVWRVGESVGITGINRSVEIGMENERLEKLIGKIVTAVGTAALDGGEHIYETGVFRTLSEIVVIYETGAYVAGLAPEEVDALAEKSADKVEDAAKDWAKKKLAQQIGKTIAKTFFVKEVMSYATKEIAKTAIAKTFARKMSTAVVTSKSGVGNLITAYGLMGFVQKMSLGSQRLKSYSATLHNDAVRADVDLLWMFIEPVLDQLKKMVADKVDEVLNSA